MVGGIVDVNGVQPKPGDTIVYDGNEYDLGVVTRVQSYRIWCNWLSDGKEEYLTGRSFKSGRATVAPRA